MWDDCISTLLLPNLGLTRLKTVSGNAYLKSKIQKQRETSAINI